MTVDLSADFDAAAENADPPRDSGVQEGPPPPNVEREPTDAAFDVYVTAAGSPLDQAEIVIVPFGPDWETALRRPYGVVGEEIERLAERREVPAGGRLSIPRPGERFFLGARAPGFAPAARLVESDEDTAMLELNEGSALRVAALDHANARIPGVSFEVFFDSRTYLEINPDTELAKLAVLPLFRSQAMTGDDSVATIEHLAPGTYRIIARHPRFAQGIAWGALVPMAIDPFIMSMEPRAFVDGFVRSKRDGKPLAGARVEIRHLVNGQWWGDSCSVLTGDDGYFVCDNTWGSPAGNLDGRAMCWKDGYGVQAIALGFLKPDERKRIEFALEQSATFHGRVEDGEGNPRDGVRLMAVENGLNLESTTSREDGTFTVHSLAKDFAFYFYASGPGIAPTHATVPSPWPTPWPFVVRVEPTFSLSGRLIADAENLEGARVRVALETNRTTRWVEKWVDADPLSGSFRFEDLPPGRYYVDAIARGYVPKRVREIAVGKGAATSEIEIRMERGCRVAGFVRSAATNAPLEGARVGFADFGEISDGTILGTIDVGVTTDSAGRFEIDSVERGKEAVLTVDLQGYARQIDRFAVGPAATIVERAIHLRNAGRLAISVIRPDGQPAGDFHVVAVDSDGNERLADGSTRVILEGLAPTTHDVKVYLRDAVEDYWGAIRAYDNIEIREDEETTLLANFADGLVIRGRILGDVARSYTGGFGAFAFLWKDGRWDSHEFCEVRRNDLGFSIFGLEPGTYKVQVESLDRQPMLSASRVVELTADHPCLLDYAFGEFVLEGRVTDVVGRPIVGAGVSLSPENESEGDAATGVTPGAIVRATSASDGRYAVAGLVPGSYRVRIDADGCARLRTRLVVDEREPIAKQDFELDPECKLRVEVVDRGELSILTRDVTVRPLDATHAADEYDASAVDSDGLTIVRGAGTGRYALAVTAPGFFPHRSTIACVAGAPLDVRVTMRRLAGLRLVARDALGAPLKHASFSIADLETGEDVSAWIADGLLSTSPDATSTDESGKLRIDGIPEGRYRVLGYGIDGEVETSFDPDAKPTTLAAIR